MPSCLQPAGRNAPVLSPRGRADSPSDPTRPHTNHAARRCVSRDVARWSVVCGFVLIWCWGNQSPLLAATSKSSREASTSKEAQRQALRHIRLDQVPRQFHAPVREVLKSPSIYRRMPTAVVDCHSDLFAFLSDNPEVLVAIWRQLGISKVTLQRKSERMFDLSDGNGTTGKLIILSHHEDAQGRRRTVMYATGEYEGKPFKRAIGARCVVLLRSGTFRETNERRFVAARLDTFLKFDRADLELAAKVLHPWVGSTADRNFTDTIAFIGNLSTTAEHRPDAVERLAADLSGINAAQRGQLVRVARQCHRDGQLWLAGRRRGAQAQLSAKAAATDRR